MHLPLFQTDHPTENIASVNTCKASTVPHWFHTGIHTEAHWFHTVPHWLGLKVKVFILTYSHIHFHLSLLSHSPENGIKRVLKTHQKRNFLPDYCNHCQAHVDNVDSMAARSDVYSGKGIPYLMVLSDFTLVWKREALKHSSSNRQGSLFSNTVAPTYLKLIHCIHCISQFHHIYLGKLVKCAKQLVQCGHKLIWVSHLNHEH